MIVKNEDGNQRTVLAFYYVDSVPYVIIKSPDEETLLAYKFCDLNVMRFDPQISYQASEMNDGQPIFHIGQIDTQILDGALDAPAEFGEVIDILPT